MVVMNVSISCGVTHCAEDLASVGSFIDRVVVVIIVNTHAGLHLHCQSSQAINFLKPPNRDD